MRCIRTVLAVALLLVAATAGAASAGALITSARIKNGTVGAADVRNASLDGAEVRNGSLGLADLTALEPGVKGLDGPAGDPGPNGVPGLTYRNAGRAMAPDQQLTWKAECDPGEQAIAGGVSSTRPESLIVVRSSPDRFHWSAEVWNTAGETVHVFVWAQCVPAPGPDATGGRP
jgi:hypothetical protein